MDIKLLLLKTTVALYYFSLSGNKDAKYTKDLVSKVVSRMDIPDDPLDRSKERSTLSNLRNTVLWLNESSLTSPIDHLDLMSRLEISCGEDVRTYNLFVKNIIKTEEEDTIINRYSGAIDDLVQYLNTEELVDTLRKASRTIGFDRSSISNILTFKREIIEKLSSIKLGDEGVIREDNILDLGNLDKLEETFHKAALLSDNGSVLKFPLKAMNRMFGEQDGGRRGEYANVSAPSGHNKTGNLLDAFVSFCIFNKPVLLDPEKKPLHVYTTIEDPVTEVIKKIYVLLQQHEHGIPISLRGVCPKEQAEYVSRKLTENGWNVKIVDFENGGSPFSYISQLNAFIEQGYEIFSAGCDYVHLMGKSAIGHSNDAENAKGLHRVISDFTTPRDIFHYTAHQLSSEARTEMRNYPDDFISRLVDKGFYEGSKTLNTEFGFEWYTAKIIKDGVAWQVFEWGKHRKLGATDEKDKHFAVKYYPVGMIGYPYDLHLEKDLSYKKVGNRNTSGDGNEWSDFD